MTGSSSRVRLRLACMPICSSSTGEPGKGTRRSGCRPTAGNPPVSFVLPFHVRHQPGPFRTVLVSVVPRSVGPWPHFAHFQIVVGRRFSYRGHTHSYMSASCPVPPRFTEGFLSFARATFNLAEGSRVRAEAVRSCRAR